MRLGTMRLGTDTCRPVPGPIASRKAAKRRTRAALCSTLAPWRETRCGTERHEVPPSHAKAMAARNSKRRRRGNTEPMTIRLEIARMPLCDPLRSFAAMVLTPDRRDGPTTPPTPPPPTPPSTATRPIPPDPPAPAPKGPNCYPGPNPGAPFRADGPSRPEPDVSKSIGRSVFSKTKGLPSICVTWSRCCGERTPLISLSRAARRPSNRPAKSPIRAIREAMVSPRPRPATRSRPICRARGSVLVAYAVHIPVSL